LLPAEQAWVAQLAALPAAAGALDRERAYVPLQEGGTVALARETGEPAWTNALGTPWPLLLAPGAVILITTDEVAALDRENGRTRWRVPLPARSIAPGIVAGDFVVVPLDSRSLIALRAVDGGVAWTARVEGLAAPVALAADPATIYVTMDAGRLAAIATASGEVRWRVNFQGTLSPPAVGKGRVFVGSTSNAFFALEPDTGKQEWFWGPTMIGGDVIGAAVDGDLAFFVGLDNLLHAVNRGNGNQRWKQPTPMRPVGPPIAFGGIVVVFGVSPAMATFNAKTGAPIATYVIPTPAGATTTPLPKGPPLVDPDLHPFEVAAVVVTADGRAIGLRPVGMMFREATTVPFTELPGRQLQRERLPSP
jgi:outer membrane protein assembly factor BamB